MDTLRDGIDIIRNTKEIGHRNSSKEAICIGKSRRILGKPRKQLEKTENLASILARKFLLGKQSKVYWDGRFSHSLSAEEISHPCEIQLEW